MGDGFTFVYGYKHAVPFSRFSDLLLLIALMF